MLNLLLKLLGMEIYTVPVISFKEQFGSMMTMQWKTVKVKTPNGSIISYDTFPIDEIKCFNRHEIPCNVKVKPSIEIRITHLKNKKSIFYFDRIRVQDNKIIGQNLRTFKFKDEEISLETISKIEIQDGKKYYRYV